MPDVERSLVACCVLAAVILSHLLWPWRWARRVVGSEARNDAVAWGLEQASVSGRPRVAGALALLLLATLLTVAGVSELASAATTPTLCTVRP